MLTQRDLDRLTGCHPSLIAKVGAAFDVVKAREGLEMFIVSGLRTQAQQQADYAKGRTVPGPNASPTKPLGDVVTFKDGVTHRSDHQAEADTFGHAADCAFQTIRSRTNPFSKDWPWETFGEALEAQGLQWGGRWKMADLDHAQLP